MTAETASFEIRPAHFGDREADILRYAEISVTGFRYPSDVEALRIDNGAGELIVLPFRGQQIWDATFLGRRLTRRSMFKEPARSCDYLSNYGAFLIHCGLTARLSGG